MSTGDTPSAIAYINAEEAVRGLANYLQEIATILTDEFEAETEADARRQRINHVASSLPGYIGNLAEAMAETRTLCDIARSLAAHEGDR